MTNTWWLGRWNYTWFMLREWSSAFVAYFLVVTLLQIAAISAGGHAYAEWRAWMREPLMVVWNIIAFIFLVFHATSWFHLVPEAMYPRHHGKRLSEWVTTIPGYIIWVIASVVIGLFALGVI